MGRQNHRGQHSNDATLFANKWRGILNQAVTDLSYLLSRGYGEVSSLQLVGNRYQLQERQRKALLRAACPDTSRDSRAGNQLLPESLAGKKLAIDGYNILITVESMLAGGIILHCRDGCLRDIASVHGNYRKVEETLPALSQIGQSLHKLQVASVTWYLDAPVSNSGRLKSLLSEWAQAHDFSWEIHLVNNPDRDLIALQDHVVLSSDSWILDNCKTWFNLPHHLRSNLSEAKVISLRGV